MAAFRMRAADRLDCRDMPGSLPPDRALTAIPALSEAPGSPPLCTSSVPASLLYLRWLPTPTPSALGGVWSS